MNSRFWQERNVFLTGHTGFKGAWLSLLLHRLGAFTHGYSKDIPTSPSLYELADVSSLVSSSVKGDVRDFQTLKKSLKASKASVVVHMAAQSLVRDSYDDPIATYDTNVMGTVNLLQAVRSCPTVEAVVIVTSDKCYENKEWIWPYRESDRMGGHDPYSNSKGCAELVTDSFRNSFFSDSKTAVASARAGNVIGGGDFANNRLLPDFFRA